MGAVVKLKHTYYAGSAVSVYDQFVAVHLAVTSLSGAQTVDGAHGGPAFLAWHREYLRRFEVALQSVDPRVTIPYWNWGLGPIAETTAIFVADKIGPMGSGGASGFEVGTGYLAQAPNTVNPLGWAIRQELQPLGAALQRNKALDTGAGWPTVTSVGSALGQGAYHLFRPALEQSPHHNQIHVRVGRDMARMTSPNDPVFWLHHAQVDRLWAKWQETHPGLPNYNPMQSGGVGHRANDMMWPWDGGASKTTILGIAQLLPSYAGTDIVRCRDVIDHRALGYCYDDEAGCPCENRVIEPTTMIRGEEGPSAVWAEEPPTTLRFGEEEPVTTLALGEEGPITRVEDGPITRAEDIVLTQREDPPGFVPPRRRGGGGGPFGDF
ncbi:MAG: tyrosinase family protein [Myxococcales bacterium]|nr:tyrosinase family protein [Myxococcales bacterium]